ncbi:septal ring lytic transglycosylase RlpA family protein [Actinomadura hibisca]|uniref:septal ring lytic transglycosylase RlpA family protein n=1 Tax=Actinomadura hibisca TaxID=68565 RepID=UPI001FE1840E|nr:septal ring lytic transglycosylase RlpA family protein [Actinomadura hibisca]
MGNSGKHRPKSRLRLILVASGVAVAMLAAGAAALFVSSGSPESARASQALPQPAEPQATVPMADPPRATPTRASRGQHRTDKPVRKPTVAPSAAPTKAKKRPEPKKTPKARVLSSGSCEASYYWEGQMTASGERFDPSELTAAHKTLPMGSKVRVTNKNNGKSVTVRINDRGPYVGGRCLDLSKAAMAQVGGTGSGVVPVRYEVLART